MPGLPWTESELELIREALRRGIPPGIIAADERLLARHPSSGIYGRVERIRSEEPGLAEIKFQQLMPKQEHSEFVAFLRRAVKEGRAPEEMMIAWNRLPGKTTKVKIGRIRYWLEKLRIRPSKKEVLQTAYSRRVREQSRRKAAAAMRQTTDAAHERCVAALRRMRDDIVAANPDTPLVACSSCAEPYPAEEPFYYMARVSDSGLRKPKSGRCRPCTRREVRLHYRKKTAGEWNPQEDEKQRREAVEEACRSRKKTLRRRRRALLAADKKKECRRCVDCSELWPLHTGFFRAISATGRFSYVCLLCEAEIRRLLRRARADGIDSGPIRKRMEQNRLAVLALQREAVREKALADRSKYAEKRRFCRFCRTYFPFHRRFWRLSSSRRTDGRVVQTIERGRCRFCNHDLDAQLRQS